MPPLPSTPFPTVLFHKQFCTVGLAPRARPPNPHLSPRAACCPSLLPSPFAPPEPLRELRFAVAAAAAGRQGAQRATAPRPSSSILVEGSFWQEFSAKGCVTMSKRSQVRVGRLSRFPPPLSSHFCLLIIASPRSRSLPH